jgi:hypothetical protein
VTSQVLPSATTASAAGRPADRRDTVVLTNFGTESVWLFTLVPPSASVLLASTDLDDGKVATDVTVWLRG